MSNSGGVQPPDSGDPSKPAHDQVPEQSETAYGKSFSVKGETGIKRWAKQAFPGMTPKQLDEFQQRFLMTVVQQINQQIKLELRRARKLARKLKEAEEGDD